MTSNLNATSSNAKSKRSQADPEKIADSREKISVIIVNYNGATFIEQCLESVRRNCGSLAEIVVLDNASTDESIELLAKLPYCIQLVKSEVNLGFARGVNTAARNTSGSVLLLINPDAQLRDPIQPALDRLRSDTNIGVLGLNISFPDGQPQESYGFDHTPARIVLSWTGLARLPIFGHLFARSESRYRRYSDERYVEWVSGAGLLVKRSTWSRVGGFDERYFMYVEDVDFCKSVRTIGERVAYTPRVRVSHKVGGSVLGYNEPALLRTARNYLLYCDKWHGSVSVELVRFGLAVVFFARWIAMSIRNFFSLGDIDRLKNQAIAQRHVAAALLFRRWRTE